MRHQTTYCDYSCDFRTCNSDDIVLENALRITRVFNMVSSLQLKNLATCGCYAVDMRHLLWGQD